MGFARWKVGLHLIEAVARQRAEAVTLAKFHCLGKGGDNKNQTDNGESFCNRN